MKAFALSHQGLVRPNNEDNYLSHPKQRLFAVADGMGGHAGGEVASQIAVDTVAEYLKGEITPDKVAGAFVAAHKAIDQRVKSAPELQGMGTTLTLAVIRPGNLLIGHIGDSRAYLVDSETAKFLTTDHTVCSQLLAAGKITQEEARSHPQRHVLTRVLGASTDLGADVDFHPWQPGQHLLLCTDGLSSLLREDEMTEIVNYPFSLEQRVNLLMSTALERGAPDNVTLVLAELNATEEGGEDHDWR